VNTVTHPDTSATVSLFQNHLLEVKSRGPALHFTQYDYLITSVLCFAYILFVWLYISNRKRLSQIIKGLYIGRYANQFAREGVSVGNRLIIFLSALFVLTVSLFFYQTVSYYGLLPSQNVASLFFITAFIILSIYVIKLTVIKFAGFLFETQKEIREYTVSVFLFCNTVGLFMLPLVICLAFFKQVNPLIFIYSGFGLIILLFLTRLVRGLIIGLNSPRVSKFYLFLYLCTLEIVPLVILSKFFMVRIAA
jgi:hypothetical protein